MSLIIGRLLETSLKKLGTFGTFGTFGTLSDKIWAHGRFRRIFVSDDLSKPWTGDTPKGFIINVLL
jgi:hypothetical protein